MMLHDSISSLLNIHTGVQGSVFRPLLFYIYINDLPYITDRFNIIMYADDTTLYDNREDFASFETDVNSNLEVEILNNWFFN